MIRAQWVFAMLAAMVSLCVAAPAHAGKNGPALTADQAVRDIQSTAYTTTRTIYGISYEELRAFYAAAFAGAPAAELLRMGDAIIQKLDAAAGLGTQNIEKFRAAAVKKLPKKGPDAALGTRVNNVAQRQTDAIITAHDTETMRVWAAMALVIP